MQNEACTKLAFDNDQAGQIAADNLIENYFKQNKIKYLTFDNLGYKDANKALVNDREKFKDKVYNLIEKINKKIKQDEMS